MVRIGAALFVAVVFCSGPSPLVAQELLDATEEELIAREKIRSTVESVLTEYLSAPGTDKIEAAIEGIQRLQPFGDEVVPYLSSELERESHDTYDFIAYALGFMRTPGAAYALRDAIDRAESSIGAAALVRKAWACWALGLHQELDALELLNSGTHRAAHYAIHAHTSTLEAIALQTAPECVPKLIEQYERWGASENEKLRGDRRYVLRALRRVADPAAIPKLVEIVREDDDPEFRAQAAYALRSMESSESIGALMAGLKDEDALVRRAAAFALEWMMPPGDAAPLLEILETETDTKARGALYRIVARRIRPEQLSSFLEHWNRPDPDDRRLFIKAVVDQDNAPPPDVLYEALQDPVNAVALTAIGRLARSENPDDLARLIAELDSSSRLVIVQTIAETAGRLRLNSLGPNVTRRLLEALQVDPETQPKIRTIVDKLGRALIAMNYTAALSKLRRARKNVEDRLVGGSLDATIGLLELLRKNGKSVQKWIPLAEDPDPERRRLAYRRLVELGGNDAAAALVQAFDASEAADRISILTAIADLDTPATRALIRRVVLDPEVGPTQRNAAAWAARTFGGPAMFDLLAEAVTLRDGRDAEVLVYAAAVGGPQAASLIKEFRLIRMRYISHLRGKEQEVLDWIAHQSEQARPIGRYDRPPARLSFR